MFKFLIEGKTIKELKANCVEFFKEFESLQPAAIEDGDQEDFLTDAAAAQPIPFGNPSAPFAPVPIQKESGTEKSVPVMTSAVANEVDAKGFPWDARIHASSHEKTAKGTWRYRRGVEDSTKYQVEQELIAKAKGLQAAEMVTLPPPIPQNQHPSNAPAPVLAPVPLAVVPPVIPPVVPPMPPPIPALPNLHTAETFHKNLIPVLAKLVKEGKLDQDYITTLKTHYGVDEIYKVSPEQAAEMFNSFVEYGMIARA